MLNKEQHMGLVRYVHLGFGCAAWIVALITGRPAWGEVIEYEAKSEWIDAVGEFTTIGFTEFPHGTWVFEQYAHLGAHFVDGADIVQCCDFNLYPEDGAGLDGNVEIRIVFDEPLSYFGVDYPGYVRFGLFNNGELVYENDWFGHGQYGQFAGVSSSQPFDEISLIDPFAHQINVDDLHFGPPIPAPGALALFAVTPIGPTRRRRT
jgi:hypothetical protein